jgi:hypothetical protein
VFSSGAPLKAGAMIRFKDKERNDEKGRITSTSVGGQINEERNRMNGYNFLKNIHAKIKIH